MTAGRLEAFSDGVLAIIITIMVLELKVPQGDTLEALYPLGSAFAAYVLSFLYLGIYWNNHHHLMRTVNHVTGAIMWANLHLLFWLSLFPAVTAWVRHYPEAAWPAALYGVVLLAAALAGIGLAFVRPWMADVIYGLVAALWVVPDRRIEKGLTRKS